MGSRDSEGGDRHTPGVASSLEGADTQASELAVARTLESGDIPPGESGVPRRRQPGDLPAGTMVGEYRIEGKLGAGGMGVVFAATHPLIGKKAAVKVLRAEMCASASGVERFVQEARAVNQIGHPNIVDIFSFGTLPDGRSYFVMEWLRGESLAARMKRQPLAIGETLDILDAVCAALAAAHEKGIIHRDLKPENVFLVDVKGRPPLVKLLDFGIAKLTGSEDTRMEKTATGHLLGTPLYISPEQARGQMVDGRADIYSLGAMAFEMLALRPPFVGDSAMDVIACHLNDPPPDLGELAPATPASLRRLVASMLAKDRAARPGLEQARGGFAAARGEAPAGAARAPAGRRRVALVLAGGLAALAAVGLWWGVGGGREAVKGTGDGRKETGDRRQETEIVGAAAPVNTPEAPVKVAAPGAVAGPVKPAAPVVKEAKPAGGVVAVTIETAGATVEIDGKLVEAGEVKVEAGKHRVRASARGHRTMVKDLAVAEGQRVALPVKLERVKRSRPDGAAAPDEDSTADPFGKPAN